MAFHPNHLSQQLGLQQFSDTDNNSDLQTLLPDHHHHIPGQTSSPRSTVKDHWLNSPTLRHRHQGQYGGQATEDNIVTTTSQQQHRAGANNINQWLSRSMMQRNIGDARGEDMVSQVSNDSIMASAAAMSSYGSPDLNNQSRNIAANQLDINGGSEVGGWGEAAAVNWQNARYKAELLSHPLYEQLLSAHVSCLRIATPVYQLPRIDAQLAQSQHVVSKYSGLAGHGSVCDDKELDQFMVCFLVEMGIKTGSEPEPVEPNWNRFQFLPDIK